MLISILFVIFIKIIELWIKSAGTNHVFTSPFLWNDTHYITHFIGANSTKIFSSTALHTFSWKRSVHSNSGAALLTPHKLYTQSLFKVNILAHYPIIQCVWSTFRSWGTISVRMLAVVSQPADVLVVTVPGGCGVIANPFSLYWLMLIKEQWKNAPRRNWDSLLVHLNTINELHSLYLRASNSQLPSSSPQHLFSLPSQVFLEMWACTAVRSLALWCFPPRNLLSFLRSIWYGS